MRASIIPADGVVIVDGVAIRDIDMSAIDPSIHAIQWYDDHGEVEIKNLEIVDRVSMLRNDQITDLAPYQSLIDQWQAKRDQLLAAEAAAKIDNPPVEN